MDTTRAVGRVQRVAVTDPIVVGGQHDYVEAYAVRLSEPDRQTPEAWFSAGLGGTPPVVDWVAERLGHSSAPDSSSDWVEGFRVLESTAEVVHLEQSLPLLDVVVVARRLGDAERMMTTAITYRRPVLARLVWALVGVGHRLMVRRLIARNGDRRPATRPEGRTHDS